MPIGTCTLYHDEENFMARKRIKLQYISNDASRRNTFKKRRNGLLKKAHELGTLCDIKGCLILYGQNENVPEIWPSAEEAAQVLAKLKRLPELEQSKKIMNQEGFSKNQISKLEDQLRKMDVENMKMETQNLMINCLMGRKSLDNLDGARELTSLGWMIEIKLNELKWKIKECNNQVKTKAEGKGKAVVNAMEDLKSQKCMNDNMIPIYNNVSSNNNNNNTNAYEHFALPSLNLVDHTVSCGNNNTSNNPSWMDYFPTN